MEVVNSPVQTTICAHPQVVDRKPLGDAKDELEVLKIYDMAFYTYTLAGVGCAPMNGDFYNSTVDMAVQIALDDFVGEKLEQMTSGLLVGALFASFTIPAWIGFDEDSHSTVAAFECCIGIASILFSIAILTSLVLIQLLSRPYTKMDTAVAFWAEGGYFFDKIAIWLT
ncbi:hypothetical protein TL16_g05985 [Triparma laevis f. inornata]|nr:hypothetical protein TL16_g05985 [Triparma laevis f. inornata]